MSASYPLIIQGNIPHRVRDRTTVAYWRLPAMVMTCSSLISVILNFSCPCLLYWRLLPWASLVVRTLHPLGSMRAPRCPSILTTLQVGFGGMCVYTLHEKGIRREYCGVRGQMLRRLGRQTLRKQNYRHLSCEYMR